MRNATQGTQQNLMTLKEAARFLRVTDNFLHQHVEIPRIRVGRVWRYDRAELTDHFKRQALAH